MKMRRKFAEEGGGIGRTTLFPTLRDVGIGRPSSGPSGRTLRTMTDEQLLGPKWWGKLQVALEARRSPEVIMRKARELIISVESTLSEVTCVYQGAFSHSIDGLKTPEGTVRRLMDKGRPAFEGAFNSDFWSRPQGTDKTIKDPLKILDPELIEPNLGRLTEQPGVV